MTTLRIGLVTDIHIGPSALYDGKLRKLSDQAAPLLERFVSAMNDEVEPDLVLTLGDAIEDESPNSDRENYGNFVRICQKLSAETLHVVGNHDTVNLTDTDLATLHGREGALFFSFDRGERHIVVLHTREREDSIAVLPEEQLKWLESDLRAASYPTLVFVHHPLCEMDVKHNRWFYRAPQLCRVGNRRSVRQLLRESGKVLGVFNGHAHWNYCSVIDGIPYVTLQSLIENVEDDAPGRAAAAHAIVDVADSGRISVRVEGAEPTRYQFDPG
jgi:3',5'-cyclic AMP phosphodiesterase CpdA